VRLGVAGSRGLILVHFFLRWLRTLPRRLPPLTLLPRLGRGQTLDIVEAFYRF
jgi:hypothetical protein